jgi:alcohol dehydrogenase class IV
MLESTGRELPPMVASQWAAGSAAHLTKYSNVTNMATAQKKLIVDDAIIPRYAVFDYAMTTTMPPAFTADGGLDGISHALEVFYGLSGEALTAATPVCTQAISLIVHHLERACADPEDEDAREALGLGTDLGGYAIMLGGTNGGHLTSFSLVDCLPHGRACAVMNPYYTVFFAPEIEPQLRAVGAIYQNAGYLDPGADLPALQGRDLGRTVASAMLALSRAVGVPTRLADVDGFSPDHIARALQAAKNPQLEMKLQSMPVPLSADTVEDYMRPVLEAARTGDFSLIEDAG